MSVSGKIVLPKTYLKTRMQRKQHATTYSWQHTATYQGDCAFVTDQQQQLCNVPDYFSFYKMFFCLGPTPSRTQHILSSPRARRACALGLLLADGAPTVGRGKTFWRVNRIFFTKTALTLEQKVGKSLRSLRELQTGRWPKLGLYGKNRIFWPKTEVLGPK